MLSLWANYDKYKTIKEVAEAINAPYETVRNVWVPSSRKLSTKLKQCVASDASFSDEHGRELLKYPHSLQNKFADLIIKKQITRAQLRELTKKYDTNPDANLDELTDKALGIETVTVPKSKCSLREQSKSTRDIQASVVKTFVRHEVIEAQKITFSSL